jgi:hypothetical protein
LPGVFGQAFFQKGCDQAFLKKFAGKSAPFQQIEK